MVAVACKSSVVKVGADKRVTAILANRQHPTALEHGLGPPDATTERASMTTERVRVKVCTGDWCPHA